MRNYIILFFVLIFSFNISAQEQLKHKMKWYTDKDGNFYTNKKLPVYIRLSHSPEEGAPSHLLKSQSMPQYTNPMYFDMEGYNTLRSPSAVDTATKRTVQPKIDIKFEVYADGLPPKSTIKFANSNKYVGKNGKIYYGKNLTVELSANDAVSGVEDIYYSVNGSPYQIYKNNIAIDHGGNFTIKYYSVDNVGNVEEAKSSEFVVDLNPPKTMHTIKGSNIGSVVSPRAKITLRAKDSLSGVKRIMYYFNDDEPRLYTQPIPLSRLQEGDVRFGFFAIDNVGNSGRVNQQESGIEGTNNEYKFLLDKSGPQVKHQIIGDSYQAKQLFVSTRSKIKLYANDKTTSVKNITYGINENADKNTYSEPFSLSNLQRGFFYINFTATDQLGNIGANNVLAVFLDNKAPTSYINIEEPKFKYDDMLFISNKTNISIKSIDNDSKVKSIEHLINNENLSRETNFTIPTEGKKVISYKAIDNVNNVEKEKFITVIVDNNPPAISAVFSIANIGTKNKNGKDYPVYPPKTNLFLAAKDAISGIEQFTYSINEEKTRHNITNNTSSTNKVFKKEGFYTLHLSVSDKVKNTKTETISFFIQNSN